MAKIQSRCQTLQDELSTVNWNYHKQTNILAWIRGVYVWADDLAYKDAKIVLAWANIRYDLD